MFGAGGADVELDITGSLLAACSFDMMMAANVSSPASPVGSAG